MASIALGEFADVYTSIAQCGLQRRERGSGRLPDTSERDARPDSGFFVASL
jgi:hypothetical protein